MTNSLAQSLRLETETLHRELERTALMRDLLRGRIDRASYCSLLRNLHELYVALEAALQQHALHDSIAPIYLPKLFRKDALAADLRELHGRRWQEELEVAPATHTYAARLREVRAKRPELLVAHSYVRYLGDLSGGQILKRIVSGTFDLRSAKGTQFFEFGPPAVVAMAAHQFRLGLDAIAAAGGHSSEIVAEAKRAFIMHRDLFDELEATARWRSEKSVVSREHSHLPV